MHGVNGSSGAISRDMNSLLHSSTIKHTTHGEFAKIKHLISLDTYPNYSYQTHTQDHSQHQQDESYGHNNSSFFSNLLSENGDNEFQDPVTERLFMKQKEEEKLELNARNTVMKQEQEQDVKNGGYGYMNQNLVRQNSTPLGFLSPENGFASMTKGNSSSTINNHITFSSGPSCNPSRFLPQKAENKDVLHDTKFSSLKRSIDGVLKMPHNGEETGYHTPNLVHHLSLPNTSSEMAVVDNFLKFQQDSTVPWRTRAKRGFATHPRSIAER
ncbi:hypothetical protein M8C21_013238, partial [Ambrosia artemisiifolia]